MNKCKFCNVFIKDDTEQCPLCGGVLEINEKGVNSYPDVLKKEKAISFVFRLMLFIAIVVSVICIGINYTFKVSVQWSLIVAVSLVYVLIILYMFVKEDAGYRVRTYVIASAGVALLVVIDYVLGFYRWSLTFVFPAVIVYFDIALIVLMIVNRRNWQSYILHFISMFLVSIVPIIFYLVGIITFPYVAQIAFALSLFVTLGVVILGGSRAKNELYRRFHIFGK